MEELNNILIQIRDVVWGKPLLFLILGVGTYLTILLRGVQFKYLGFGFKQIFRQQDKDAEGDISHFQSLMTSLAGAIGTGSIVGVATGVAIGGLGALFWMWVTALVGMATKYAESLLAIKYREVDERGEMVGGPMEYIQYGLGWKWLAIIFAVCGCFAAIGSGNLVQVNSIGDALFDTIGINPWITGVILAVLTGLVLMGGIREIGAVAGVLVPTMALFYLAGGVLILFLNYDKIPEAFSLIIASAFHGQAAVGAFAGSSIMLAFQMGVARSVFSNEAGLGISSIAAAAAKTDTPGRQAMVAMTGALVSTVIICTITGLTIAVTGVFGSENVHGGMLSGAALAIRAFQSAIPFGGWVVTIGLILFAYSTVLAWAYYGEKCCEYLFGSRSVLWYRAIFTLIVIPGAVLDVEVAWNFTDICNGLMAFPNLIALIALSGVMVKETKLFIEFVKKEREV